jgi:outer membrane protein TolC
MGEIAEATAALDSARRTEELTRGTLLPQAELTFRSALAGYEAGRVDFSTLIDALRQIRQARQSLIRAQAEGQARLADVERMIGEEL